MEVGKVQVKRMIFILDCCMFAHFWRWKIVSWKFGMFSWNFESLNWNAQ